MFKIITLALYSVVLIWGSIIVTSYQNRYDLNNDGNSNLTDLSILAAHINPIVK